MTIRLGLFDSGIGGFTVLKSLVERHGDVSCVYLGDLARVPYGSKTPKEIRLIASEVVHWLNKQDLTAVLVACNTTNSLALDVVEKFAEVPVFGLIDSAVEMIYEKRVGILATPGTVFSKAYSKKILEKRPGTFVVEQACPAFVPMIETGLVNNEEICMLAKKYLKPLIESQVESIILGCSHYPLLLPILRPLVPSHVRLIDPAIGMAKNLDKLLVNHKFVGVTMQNSLNTKFYVTSDPNGFAARAKHWLKIYPEVELISLRSKACVF